MNTIVMIAKCPKCGSTNCFPTEDGFGWGAMCVPCGHEFDMRGSVWTRIKRWLFGTITR